MNSHIQLIAPGCESVSHAFVVISAFYASAFASNQLGILFVQRTRLFISTRVCCLHLSVFISIPYTFSCIKKKCCFVFMWTFLRSIEFKLGQDGKSVIFLCSEGTSLKTVNSKVVTILKPRLFAVKTPKINTFDSVFPYCCPHLAN